MARPVFLSYAWDDEELASRLETQLRLRGVPVWRDRRGMRWGGYNEEVVLEAIEQRCSGFILLLTAAALDSDFICDIEVPAMARRRSADPAFFAGAVVSHEGGIREATHLLRERTVVDLSSELGSQLSDEDLANDIQRAASAVLRSYLGAELAQGATAHAHIETRSPVRDEELATLHLSWSPPLANDLDGVGDEIWTDDLLPALADIRAALEEIGAHRTLVVSGRPHLSAAIALAYEFRAPTGWTLSLQANGDEVTTKREDADTDGWTIVREPSSSGADHRLVLCLHATKDVTRAMQEHCRTIPTARVTIHVRPLGGPGHMSVDVGTVNGVCAAIEAAITDARTRYGVQETHMYLACPWFMAAVLGWQLSSIGRIVCHEPDVERSSYRATCQLS
jgi:hypothetical protein